MNSLGRKRLDACSAGRKRLDAYSVASASMAAVRAHT